jgi:uncharacterized protein YkwD
MPFRIACLASATAAACLLLPAGSRADDDRCPGAGDAPTAATTQQAARAIACLVDAERDKRGLTPLAADEDLDLAARRHSRDMVRHAVFSHTGTDGSGLADRARAAGYALTGRWSLGEALGWGTGSLSTPQALIEEWLASPPHRRILLDPGFTRIGAGVAAGAPHPTGDALPAATYTLDLAG